MVRIKLPYFLENHDNLKISLERSRGKTTVDLPVYCFTRM